MIYKKTITNFIARLSQLVELGASKSDFTKSNKLPKKYFEDTYENISNHYKEGLVNKEDMDKINELWNKLPSLELPFAQETAASTEESVSDDTTLEQVVLEADDDRNSVNLIRDEDGKIKFYEFKVLRKDKAPLTGRLTRDEMNNIHRMYSYYGMSITQREVSRYFPEYSLIDFKRILRVFSITKAVAPFAPHIIEEHTQEELVNMQMREKENDFLRTMEEQSIKNDRLLLKKYALENIELKRKLEEGIKVDLVGLDLSNIGNLAHAKKYSLNKDVVIYLSDMHIGAFVSPLSIYSNPYNKAEVIRRMDVILDQLFDLNRIYKGFNNIYVCNLGDSLDGYDGQTTRGGHSLPQNMCNKEQIHTFIECMNYFFTRLSEMECNFLNYICVGESNHDGDFGYAANVALEAILSHRGVNCTIFDKFIGEFMVGDTTFVLCHGKDNKDMFKNLPLTLDVKTENFINEYLDNKKIYGKVVFVKGDLHQSATTYGRRFTYKSVGSLFGSSEWIHKNFGNTLACTDYSIVSENSIIDGRIVLQ